MTPEQHQRLTDVFTAVCELPAESRSDALDELCGDEDWLRTEVESLLKHHDTPAVDLLPAEKPLPDLFSHDINPDLAEEGDQRIGRYRVIRVIGQGGMGTVYLAEQDRPRRTIAVKIIRSDLMSPSVLRRFEFEQETLGRLQHPGIARIYEAGIHRSPQQAARSFQAADRGRPYFVMEYVEGLPLNEYVLAENLSVRDRLGLMVKVCEAVEYAHQKGIVHRDLKPGNILVETASGNPKILDFGVARATDSDRAVTTMQTNVGQLLGTLAYMSPEQVAADSTAVDTRSDVYALGVICYELLASHLPHDVRSRSLPEAARLIRDEDPTPLSTVSRVFRGDLETIVARAMEKDPLRRYQTAGDFADDITRYLEDQPIVARRPSAMYQFRKFARRNKALVGGVAGIMVALIAGVIGTSSALVKARLHLSEAVAARQLAEDNAVRAEREAFKATQVFDLFTEVLGGADPDRAAGRELTVREMLDEAVVQIRQGEEGEGGFVAGDPAIHLALLAKLGELHHHLGLYEQAYEMLAEAISMSDLVTDIDPIERFNLMSRMVKLALHRGRNEEAERRANDALELALSADDWHVHVRALIDRGRVRLAFRDYELAEQLLREAIAMCESAEPLGRRGMIQYTNAMMILAQVQYETVRYDEALELHKRIVQIRRGMHGDRHTNVATALDNYALALARVDRHREAARLHREALDIRRELYGKDHPVVATSHHNLALAHAFAGELREAIEAGREAVRIRVESFGESHPRTLTTMTHLGSTLTNAGRGKEAGEILERVVELARSSLADDPILANYIGALAWQRFRQGEIAEAYALYEEAIAIFEQEGPSLHFATALSNFSRVLQSQRDIDGAANAIRRSVDMRRRALGGDDSSVATSLVRLGYIVELQGNLEESIAIQSEALDIYARTVGADHYLAGLAYAQLGRTYTRAGKCEDGRPLLLHAMPILDNRTGVALASYRGCEDALINCLISAGEYEEAEERLIHAYRQVVGNSQSGSAAQEAGDSPSRRVDVRRQQQIASHLLRLYESWMGEENAEQMVERAIRNAQAIQGTGG